MIEFTVDFDSPDAKRRLYEKMKFLRGKHDIAIKKHRNTRSGRANRYYWGCVLPCVAQGIQDAYGESVTTEEAHEFCKTTFLSRPVVNKYTGEVKGWITGHTPKLNSEQFAEYLDKIIRLCAEKFSVIVPDTDSF